VSVRRLAEHQPGSFAFTPQNLEWAKREIAKYPPGRQASAVISLLWRAQDQEGWVTEPAIRLVADMLDMAHIRVLEVATFYTMFHLEPVGQTAHIHVCGTTPCWLRGANDLKDVCRARIGPEYRVSRDGRFSWEEVECIGACVNAPVVQIGADTYEDLTPATFEKLIDNLAAGRATKPGPAINRQFSAPVGGETTLKDRSLYQRRSTPANVGAPLTDDKAKRPADVTNVRDAAAPQAPLQPNPEDKKPDPVSKV
jgi:NADH-quinone oxidoreductase subunit E